LQTLSVKTARRTQLVDVTTQVQKVVASSGVSNGICYLYVPHTTAAIAINECADPDVARDGRIFYRNTVIAVDELSDRIRESIKNGADRKLYIRADACARYGDIQRVLDEISKTGIRDVCFIAEKVSP